MAVLSDTRPVGTTTVAAANTAPTSTSGPWDEAATGTQGAWRDRHGNTWRNVAGKFEATEDGGLGADGYRYGQLLRPAAEDGTTRTVFAVRPANSSRSSQFVVLARFHRTGLQHYHLWFDTSSAGNEKLRLYTIDSSGGGVELGQVAVPSWDETKDCTVELAVSGTSPTSLAARLYKDGQTTHACELTHSDNTSGLQTSGAVGVGCGRATGNAIIHTQVGRVTVADTVPASLPGDFSPSQPPVTTTYTGVTDVLVLANLNRPAEFRSATDHLGLFALGGPLRYTVGVALEDWSSGAVPTDPTPADGNIRLRSVTDVVARAVQESSEVSFWKSTTDVIATYESAGLSRYRTRTEASGRFRFVSEGRIGLLLQDLYPR